MRLTVDLLEKSTAFTNALELQEIDLRNNKIPAIENLAITRDLYDVIDMSHNEIRRLDNFPALPRLQMLFLANNLITAIEENATGEIAKKLPDLRWLNLANNRIAELKDLNGMRAFKGRKLQHLLLTGNPVCKMPGYRQHLVALVPTLKSLDMRLVTKEERESALAWASKMRPAEEKGTPSAKKARTMTQADRKQIQVFDNIIVHLISCRKPLRRPLRWMKSNGWRGFSNQATCPIETGFGDDL